MKIRPNFLLREVAGSPVVVPVGDATKRFNGMIKLNATGAYLWKHLANDTTEDALTDALCADYEVDRETAARDVTAFLTALRGAGILED